MPYAKLLLADDPVSCVVYVKKFDLPNTQGWKQQKDMPEQQGGSSELSRNQSTDKPKDQRGSSMDGQFQEIMHMPHNLMSKLVTPSGKMP